MLGQGYAGRLPPPLTLPTKIFAVSESLVLKIEAPDAICTIGVEGDESAKERKRSARRQS